MAITQVSNLILLQSLLSVSFFWCAAMGSTGSHFMSAGAGSVWPRRLRSPDVRTHASLEAVLHGNHGASETDVTKIEAILRPTYEAVPKNDLGRLAPRSVRHMIHNYFASQQGFLIRGLEPHGMQLNMTDVHDVDILVKKMPQLADVLSKARHSVRGLSFTDVILITATLERLILDESTELLSAAYVLNGHEPVWSISQDALQEVLLSYLIIFEIGSKANLTDVARHQLMKQKFKRMNMQSWLTLVEFEEDALNTFNFLRHDTINPFVPVVYSFEMASQIVRRMARAYGQWQNAECRQMAAELRGLDLMGSGRVPLDRFYSQPKSANYVFTESTEYLRQIGALDEGSNVKPQVRIANYLTGPSNCIASSSFFSVCCLSECEGLMRELEQKIRAPTASAEQLLGLVGNMSSSSVDAPRDLSETLVDKLWAIADRHSGKVPLHARLFAQWMHFAFPSECPYPHAVEDASVLRPSHWSGQRQVSATDEERKHLISEFASQPETASGEPLLSQWDDEEVLLLEDLPLRDHALLLSALLRFGAMALVLLSTVMAGLQALVRLPCCSKRVQKEEQLVLPVTSSTTCLT